MANVQIPNMTPAIALSGEELFEIVQGGTSKRASIDQIVELVNASPQIQDILAQIAAIKLFVGMP